MTKLLNPIFLCTFLLCSINSHLHAEVLAEASAEMKIVLAKESTTRPMTVAYVPKFKNYYIADGGLAPLATEYEPAISKSLIHTYDEKGNYINSAKAGFDNRSIYFNTNTGKLETATYNVSSEVGFSPNTGIYSLNLSETGELLDTSDEIYNFNPAFGSSGTMPSFDTENKRYFAKQGRSNLVFIVDPKLREKVGTISLDFTAAKVAHDDVSDFYAAYTGVKGEELALLDVDHKAILVFDLAGKFIAKSLLPQTLKLRSKNHFNGLGYANNLFFIFQDNEGEFGTYHGFKFIK
jgi:hypothetical protein